MTQEFDKNKLDLVKQKGLYPFEYMTDFEKFKVKWPSKEKCYNSFTVTKPCQKPRIYQVLQLE